MKKLFISIVIPTFNEEKYLEATLKAIKSQDYEGKYEIIVADGMSKDKTVKLARKYANKVITVKKRGVSVGRNAGAKIAKGDILLFLDADTILLFNALSEIAKAFRNKKVVGVTCPILPISFKASNFAVYWFYNNIMKITLKRKTPQVAGMCCAYRKDAFEKIRGFNENMYVYEDLDFSKRIGKFGKIVFVESTLALTSPRRFEAWGSTNAARKYIVTYLNYFLAGKRVPPNEYKPVR